MPFKSEYTNMKIPRDKDRRVKLSIEDHHRGILFISYFSPLKKIICFYLLVQIFVLIPIVRKKRILLYTLEYSLNFITILL